MADIKPVALREVVDAMDMTGDTLSSYLNRKTGELVSLTEDVMNMAECDDDCDLSPEWEQEMVLKAKEVVDSDDYLRLPDRYEIDKYRIMDDFCYSVEDDRIKRDLLHGIKGRGAFRRFKDVLYSHGIEKDWYRFRDEKLEEIAVDWLEANGIPFIREETPASRSSKD